MNVMRYRFSSAVNVAHISRKVSIQVILHLNISVARCVIEGVKQHVRQNQAKLQRGSCWQNSSSPWFIFIAFFYFSSLQRLAKDRYLINTIDCIEIITLAGFAKLQEYNADGMCKKCIDKHHRHLCSFVYRVTANKHSLQGSFSTSLQTTVILQIMKWHRQMLFYTKSSTGL